MLSPTVPASTAPSLPFAPASSSPASEAPLVNFLGMGQFTSEANESSTRPPSYESVLSGGRTGFPPPYWTDGYGGATFPPGPDDPVAEPAPPHIGDLGRAGLSPDLSGAQRDRAITHRNNIDIKSDAVDRIATEFRNLGLDVSTEPLNFFPLANSLIELRNAWSRGDLVESSRYIRVPPSAANDKRATLEDNIASQADHLARQIHANVLVDHHVWSLSAMGDMKRMKV